MSGIIFFRFHKPRLLFHLILRDQVILCLLPLPWIRDQIRGMSLLIGNIRDEITVRDLIGTEIVDGFIRHHAKRDHAEIYRSKCAIQQKKYFYH